MSFWKNLISSLGEEPKWGFETIEAHTEALRTLSRRLRDEGFPAQADDIDIALTIPDLPTERLAYLWTVLDDVLRDVGGKLSSTLRAEVERVQRATPGGRDPRRPRGKAKQVRYDLFRSALIALDQPLREAGAPDASAAVYNFLSRRLDQKSCTPGDLADVGKELERVLQRKVLGNVMAQKVERLARWSLQPETYIL